LLPLSVIILTFNDENLIEDCLNSLESLSDDIHVVDSGSTDQTLQILSRYQVRIHSHPFENYAAQRNWAQDNLPVRYEWVLHLDSDERVSSELVQELQQFFSQANSGINGLMISRRTVFLGKWIRYGGHYPVYHLRVFKKAFGRCEDRLYDQHFVVSGNVVKMRGDIIDLVTSDLDTWMKKHIRWARLEALEQLHKSGSSSDRVLDELSSTPIGRRRRAKQSVYYRFPLFARAFAYFGYRYFLRLGFLDGRAGVIFHFLHGFWFRFYVDACIWEATHSSTKKERACTY
jgi:glycosyltransferase involved in cell wall biosynthesis